MIGADHGIRHDRRRRSRRDLLEIWVWLSVAPYVFVSRDCDRSRDPPRQTQEPRLKVSIVTPLYVAFSTCLLVKKKMSLIHSSYCVLRCYKNMRLGSSWFLSKEWLLITVFSDDLARCDVVLAVPDDTICLHTDATQAANTRTYTLSLVS